MIYRDLTDVLERLRMAPNWGGAELKDPNQPGIFGNRPLGIAARFGDVEAMSILLGAGAEIDGRGEDNFTPLHDAIDERHVEAVQFLLERGASLTCINDDGNDARSHAAMMGYEDIVTLIDEFVSKLRT